MIPEHGCSLVDPNIIIQDHVVLLFSLYLVPGFCSEGSSMMSQCQQAPVE